VTASYDLDGDGVVCVTALSRPALEAHVRGFTHPIAHSEALKSSLLATLIVPVSPSPARLADRETKRAAITSQAVVHWITHLNVDKRGSTWL